uniref:CRAL/TRIO N-terminal domain-containing protein n=1 Tax=Arundo donax TaxID=35708 RepID=A0A0A9FCB8_ARUDO
MLQEMSLGIIAERTTKCELHQGGLTHTSTHRVQCKVNEVRELLGDLPTEMPTFLSDGTIRRFLRAKNWRTEQATKALKEAVKWSRQYKPDKICWEDLAGRENETRRAYISDYLDKTGRTVFVVMTSIKVSCSG